MLSALARRVGVSLNTLPRPLGRWCHPSYSDACDADSKADWATRDNDAGAFPLPSREVATVRAATTPSDDALYAYADPNAQ